MAADAPAITRYHPRYHLRRRYHLKYPRCAAPLKLNYPPRKKGKQLEEEKVVAEVGEVKIGKVSAAEIYRSLKSATLSNLSHPGQWSIGAVSP